MLLREPRVPVWEEEGVGLQRMKVGEGRVASLFSPLSLPQHFVPRSVSMAAVWHPINASVCKTGEVTTAPVVSGWWWQGPRAHPPYQGTGAY